MGLSGGAVICALKLYHLGNTTTIENAIGCCHITLNNVCIHFVKLFEFLVFNASSRIKQRRSRIVYNIAISCMFFFSYVACAAFMSKIDDRHLNGSRAVDTTVAHAIQNGTGDMLL